LGSLDSWGRVLDRVKAPDIHKEYRHAAGVLAAHLTYDRLDYEDKNILPSEEIQDYLQGLWRSFLAALPEDRRPWFAVRSE
jgi:hypothetical protein